MTETKVTLWTAVIILSFAFFNVAFDISDTSEEYSMTGIYPSLISSKSKNDYLFVYRKKDLTAQKTAELMAKNEEEMKNQLKNYSSFYATHDGKYWYEGEPIFYYKFYREYTGISYRIKNHALAITVGFVIPITLILITALFERAIIKKINQMNA